MIVDTVKVQFDKLLNQGFQWLSQVFILFMQSTLCMMAGKSVSKMSYLYYHWRRKTLTQLVNQSLSVIELTGF